MTLLENDKSRLESEVDELRDVVRTSEEKNQQNDENNEANSKVGYGVLEVGQKQQKILRLLIFASDKVVDSSRLHLKNVLNSCLEVHR